MTAPDKQKPLVPASTQGSAETEHIHKLELDNGFRCHCGWSPLDETPTAATQSTAETQTDPTPRPLPEWKWVCEYCFRTINDEKLPEDWLWLYQSAICPRCYPKVKAVGGIHVVKGGAFAGDQPDPRTGRFNEDMIHRSGLPRDVMGLIHDLCYHVPSRGVEGYVKRAQRILSVDGCGSDVPRVSSPTPPTQWNQRAAPSVGARELEDKWMDMLAAEVKRHGGIPCLSKEEMTFREAFAEHIERLLSAQGGSSDAAGVSSPKSPVGSPAAGVESEKDECIELLRGVHTWFMQMSPEKYNGCGLWIAVDEFLSLYPRENCILEVDSPTLPPGKDEYLQCGCVMCRESLSRNRRESSPFAPLVGQEEGVKRKAYLGEPGGLNI